MNKAFTLAYYSAAAMEVPSLSLGVAQFTKQGGTIKVHAKTQTQLFDEKQIALFVDHCLASNMVIIGLHGGRESCPAFDLLSERMGEMRDRGEKLPWVHIQPTGGDEDALEAAQVWSTHFGTPVWDRVHQYLINGGMINFANLLSYLEARFFEIEDKSSPPQSLPHEGLYHPDIKGIPDPLEYMEQRIIPGRITMGIWFNQSYWLNNNLAQYRYIKHVFKADAVIHVGKHGSLEWLPGKALGLSEECYPDLSIMDLPNIYPYIINDPSEGTQAKRRSYCCIVDHLTPVFTNADLYESLSEVDNKIKEYQDARREDPGKVPVLKPMIWKAVADASFDRDLDITEERAFEDFDGFLEKLHEYLGELSDTMINEGLHTLGQVPEDQPLVEFLVQLTRVANGNVSSLRESIVSALGHDYDNLLVNRGRVVDEKSGDTGNMIIKKAHNLALTMAQALAKKGFEGDEAYISSVIRDMETFKLEGMTEDQAFREASFRVFGCPPGTYGAGVSELVESKNWETQEDLGNNYIRYSSHAYGKGSYGQQKPAVFRTLLSRMDVTVKNEDSREYDMMSCTDYYNYYGGLIVAGKTVTGKYPISLMGDSSDPKRVKMRSTAEEAKHILRSRLTNPKWIKGMMRHGYKGAGDVSHMMDVALGWDATAEVMEDWMYEQMARAYVLDEKVKEWMEEVNPYARQNILDKLLEAISRGMWQAEDDMKEQLRQEYLDIEGEIEALTE